MSAKNREDDTATSTESQQIREETPSLPTMVANSTHTDECASAQAEALAIGLVTSVNDALQESGSTQASPLLCLLYCDHVSVSMTSKTACATQVHFQHVGSAIDSVSMFADFGLLGASFEQSDIALAFYFPAFISVRAYGLLRLCRAARSVRFCRHVLLRWKCSHALPEEQSHPCFQSVSPTSWRICEDHFVLFP